MKAKIFVLILIIFISLLSLVSSLNEENHNNYQNENEMKMIFQKSLILMLYLESHLGLNSKILRKNILKLKKK